MILLSCFGRTIWVWVPLILWTQPAIWEMYTKVRNLNYFLQGTIFTILIIHLLINAFENLWTIKFCHPPMLHGFDFGPVPYVGFDFVVGSHLALRVFIQVLSGFPPSTKTNTLNSNLTRIEELHKNHLRVNTERLCVRLIKQKIRFICWPEREPW